MQWLKRLWTWVFPPTNIVESKGAIILPTNVSTNVLVERHAPVKKREEEQWSANSYGTSIIAYGTDDNLSRIVIKGHPRYPEIVIKGENLKTKYSTH